jgi:hypothetical protein
MKKTLLLLFLFVALNAFAHEGHLHTYIGTITMLHDDGSFMMQTTDGPSLHVAVTAETVYRHADGKSATRADLTTGRRVAVTMAKDGKTATLVKLGK